MECPYCCLNDSESAVLAHVTALHLDAQGQVIPSSVVDKVENQRIVEVNKTEISVTVGSNFFDQYTASPHPLLTRYVRLVVYRPLPALGASPDPMELYVFERTSASSYGEPPQNAEVIWNVGEWSLEALGNNLVRSG